MRTRSEGSSNDHGSSHPGTGSADLKDPGTIADDLLDRFSLTDAAARKVSTYSAGMRRRLDIAMSLIGNPQVIFLDEPTTGLDPEARIEVWRAGRELAANGTTVLLTTQYLDEAEQLADRIAILHDGRIIVNGTLAELKQLLPPAKVEYIEKQPTLEEIFLAIVGSDGKDATRAITAQLRASEIARPLHGGGASRGVFPLRATTTAADPKRAMREQLKISVGRDE